MTRKDREIFKRAFKNKEILITGGCGLIGSHLGRELNELGAKVTLFDSNIRKPSSGIEIIKGDVGSYKDLEKATRGKEIVFHFAALLGIEKIGAIPFEVLEVNLGGTVNALKAVKKNKVEKFVFSSSSEVYGEPLRLPVSEKDRVAPISTYGVSKLAAEVYCEAYFKKYGLKVIRLRYFNVFGPGQTENFVIPIFISNIMRDKPPVIFGDGEQFRSYTYITDAIKGTLLAAASPKAAGEIFNIGNNIEIKVKDLAYYIIKLFGKNLEPEFRYFGEGIRLENREIQRRIPDISKAKLVLGYKPEVPFEEGLKKFVDWYKRFHKLRK
jgi:nucleoside-diphosphate-sugar epimerase